MPQKKETESQDPRRSLTVLLVQIVLLVAAILVYLYFTSQIWVVDCKKDDAGMINCSVRSTVLGVLKLQERTVTGMAAATVGDDCQGAACKYRIELYDNQGVSHPVEEQYTPDNVVKEKVAKLLNEFVVKPDKKEITLREGGNWTIFMLPVTAILAFVLYRLSIAKAK